VAQCFTAAAQSGNGSDFTQTWHSQTKTTWAWTVCDRVPLGLGVLGGPMQKKSRGTMCLG
jgi:hypothetical protein